MLKREDPRDRRKEPPAVPEDAPAPPQVNLNPFAVYYFHKGEWYIVAWGF